MRSPGRERRKPAGVARFGETPSWPCDNSFSRGCGIRERHVISARADECCGAEIRSRAQATVNRDAARARASGRFDAEHNIPRQNSDGKERCRFTAAAEGQRAGKSTTFFSIGILPGEIVF